MQTVSTLLDSTRGFHMSDPSKVDQPRRRMTWQKRTIHDAITGRHDHPTAQELHKELLHHGIGLATVYRNLTHLAKEGRIQAVNHQGEVRYDCNMTEHAHVSCTVCGTLWDIPLPESIGLTTTDQIQSVDHVTLTLHGVCQNCTA